MSSSHVERTERGDPLLPKPTKSPKPNNNETPIERGNPLNSEIPEWLQEFRENLVDDEIPVHGDSHATSSHEVIFRADIQRDVRIWVSTVFKLISLKTEIARSARGPKLQGPRAEDAMAKPYLVLKNVGDLTTADHKVLSDNCESRNSHRYAVVVQDLATQWIQAYPCKTKTSQETRKELAKVLGERIGSLKSFTLTILWNWAKPVKIFPGPLCVNTTQI